MSNNFLKFSTDKECKHLVSLHQNEHATDLAIKLSKIDSEKRNFILAQIKGRQKGKEKFPELAAHKNLVYPLYVSIEQTSSELTAKYKAALFSGNTFIDLTSGFGVDDYYFSHSFKELKLVEKDKILSEIVRENFKNIGANGVECFNSSAEDYLKQNETKADLIYLDPSRRIGSKKVFRLDESEPNILELLARMRELSDQILIKLSPMMDISEIHRSIDRISSIHIVSVDNECKEILVSLEKTIDNDLIHCIELGSKPLHYSFSYSDEKKEHGRFSKVLNYLYLPNASVTKSGAFNSICKDFSVDKLSVNTHIYTSVEKIENFPGSTFKVISVSPYKKEALKRISKEKGFNLIKRNFPDDIKTIATKLKIGISGPNYLMAYRNTENKPELCICEKIIA